MVTNLCYKSSYLRLIQTHFHKRICTFSYFSSSYKFDCNRRYWMYRMGVLKRKNNSLQMTSYTLVVYICRFMHRWDRYCCTLCIYPAYLCYKPFYYLRAQIQLCKSRYTIYLPCYKFGCIHPYFVDHRDVLKLENISRKTAC